MASPFKIPKKKHPTGCDSTDLHVQSPLSRLQNTSPQFKSYSDRSSGGGADRMHAGNSLRQSKPCKPLFRDVVKTLLGLNSPNTGVSSAANHKSPGAWSHKSQPGRRSESSSDCLSIGWRPKRASDRLLQPEGALEHPSPPQKKKSELNGSSSSIKSISVESVDSLAELRREKHAGNLSLSPLGERRWWRTKSKLDADEAKTNSPESPLKSQKRNSSLSSSDQTSADDFESPSTTRNNPPADKTPPCRLSSSSSAKLVLTPKTSPGPRRTLDRMSWLAASNSRTEDVREKERQRWKEFREKKLQNRSAVLRLRLNKPRQTPAEPIVLSSEEEEEDDDDDGDGAKRSSQSCSSRTDDCHLGKSEQIQACSRDEGDVEKSLMPPSFLQLEFTSLHAGLAHVDANGKVMISESGISIPLKGVEDGEVTVVASQVRGYGVWDGGVAQGGSLLAGWEAPAPSLLFLWVSDAQANLLQKELCTIQTPTSTSGRPCSFLLLVLKEQLQELQTALLASILDMEQYQRGRTSSNGPTSPLDWTDGLLLFHSCPPPLDQHLLKLLGHSAKSTPARSSQRKSNLTSIGLQQLSSRLIQYPAAPCKGRITVTKEDLACLKSGEFLNDVIIDFYLKYLLLEGVGGSVAERSHIFSSFFYKQLSRRRAAGEDDAPSVPDRHMRHHRVKTWTRHVDIFTKDFLFVPVNQEAHWYLVVVCFPGLEEVQFEEFQSRTGASEREAGKTSAFSLSSQQSPECTQQGCQRDTVLKRPCILVMDSLKLSYHENVCRLLREYLQVEWEVRRGTPRLFTSDNMKSSNCRVPLQDNSSDCGLYLLQYAESFLQGCWSLSQQSLGERRGDTLDRSTSSPSLEPNAAV
ncbi:sentrin-specific protease 7-like isoform X2 [Anabas testudineus]|uniref:sentrin-specific protease 7-like isoform X2 n=1 Tax=Anabas testudineus TaxID=64144 RepID=UPI000E46065F|nr:sentrin-specific protease 7-like isoform X2 [Anabas testudineus]